MVAVENFNALVARQVGVVADAAWTSRSPTLSAYEDISAEVGKIAVPTLVLAGDQDRQDPVEQHKREVLPQIKGAELKIITDCGHLIPIDQPYRATSIHQRNERRGCFPAKSLNRRQRLEENLADFRAV